MSEPIIEQIAQWINDALDGVSDDDGTLTLRSIRPKILDWEPSHYWHGDVIIVLGLLKTVSKTTVESRTELATFILEGIIKKLPEDTYADVFASRMAETIRRTMLAGNKYLEPVNPPPSPTMNIDCPEFNIAPFEGGIEVIVTCNFKYQTALKDGYTEPS